MLTTWVATLLPSLLVVKNIVFTNLAVPAFVKTASAACDGADESFSLSPYAGAAAVALPMLVTLGYLIEPSARVRYKMYLVTVTVTTVGGLLVTVLTYIEPCICGGQGCSSWLIVSDYTMALVTSIAMVAMIPYELIVELSCFTGMAHIGFEAILAAFATPLAEAVAELGSVCALNTALLLVPVLFVLLVHHWQSSGVLKTIDTPPLACAHAFRPAVWSLVVTTAFSHGMYMVVDFWALACPAFPRDTWTDEWGVQMSPWITGKWGVIGYFVAAVGLTVLLPLCACYLPKLRPGITSARLMLCGNVFFLAATLTVAFGGWTPRGLAAFRALGGAYGAIFGGQVLGACFQTFHPNVLTPLYIIINAAIPAVVALASALLPGPFCEWPSTMSALAFSSLATAVFAFGAKHVWVNSTAPLWEQTVESQSGARML